MRVLVVEDEPYLADAIKTGLRLETIAADVVHGGGFRGLGERPVLCGDEIPQSCIDLLPILLQGLGIQEVRFRAEVALHRFDGHDARLRR